MAKGKKVKQGEVIWVPPEVVAQERADAADTVEELRELVANPAAGEFRHQDTGELVTRIITREPDGGVDDFECEYALHDGERADYQHTLTKEKSR